MVTSSRRIRWAAAIEFVLLTLAYGVHISIGPANSMAPLVASLTCTLWCSADSTVRRQPLVWPARLGIFLFWPYGVPLYLVWSRGFLGIPLALIVALAWFMLMFIAVVASIIIAYVFGVQGRLPFPM
jgi:hypothetical protein